MGLAVLLVGFRGFKLDHAEKTFLVRRICNAWDIRYIDFKQERILVKFTDPDSDILYQSDFIYKDAEEKGRINGLLTLKESMDILTEEGKWNSEMEVQEKGLVELIKQLKDSLNKLKFQKIQQKKNELALYNAEKSLEEIINIKTQLGTSTIEHFAETSRRRWLMRSITEIMTPGYEDLIENERFIDKCMYEYYSKSVPSMSSVRQVARTEPWRMYWSMSKNNSSTLFDSSCTNMTDLQFTVTLWSRIYDFAFDSENRPSEEVIEDDVKFDAWYEQECKRMEEKLNKSQIQGGNFSKGQEVFVPADREGAKEVYALNDQRNRSKIQKRIKHIKEQGPTTEANLPDIKRDLIMQANKQNADAVMQRSKGST